MTNGHRMPDLVDGMVKMRIFFKKLCLEVQVLFP